MEAGGLGVESGKHAASIGGGRVGVLHGTRSYVLQDEHGQIRETHSVSAGLDYPGVGPEHAFLHETGRVEYVSRTDAEALEAFGVLSRTEGIIPALEPAHAIADLAHIRLRYGAEAESAWRPGASSNRGYLDVRRLATIALVRAGLDAGAVRLVGPCTAEHPAALHSYRRDGAGAGRQLSYIGWRGDE